MCAVAFSLIAVCCFRLAPVYNTTPGPNNQPVYQQQLIGSLEVTVDEWSGERLFLRPEVMEDYVRGDLNPHTKQVDPIILPGNVDGSFPEVALARNFSSEDTGPGTGWCTDRDFLPAKLPLVPDSVCGTGWRYHGKRTAAHWVCSKATGCFKLAGL
jgi:hypothetical protein